MQVTRAQFNALGEAKDRSWRLLPESSGVVVLLLTCPISVRTGPSQARNLDVRVEG